MRQNSPQMRNVGMSLGARDLGKDCPWLVSGEGRAQESATHASVREPNFDLPLRGFRANDRQGRAKSRQKDPGCIRCHASIAPRRTVTTAYQGGGSAVVTYHFQ